MSEGSCCGPTADRESGPRSAGAPLAHSLGSDGGARAATAIRLPGGTYLMGGHDPDANHGDGEGPVREVSVGPFAIDPCPVTNEDFARFVDATGYRTEAEDFGWSFVFGSFLTPELAAASRPVPSVPWWRAVEGATWRTPEGPESGVTERQDHPVVHVSWRDAEAFAAWAGGRLPREIEWEYAARGGLEGARYVWGDEFMPGGRHMCNIFQGHFPGMNTGEDGFLGTCPVRAFPANGYGLFGMAGNVWDMIADRWSIDRANPAPVHEERRVMRGGSYLCHDSYCNRYRVAARTSNTPDSASGNLGFRLAYDL